MNDDINPATQQETLKRSVEHVAEAAEGVLRTTVDETSAEWRRAREALEKRLQALRSKLSDRTHDVASEARILGAQGRRLVRRHPWASIGAGAALGLLAGFLVRNHRKNGS